MGLSDYVWPFNKKFSQIPCAREAGIAALLGGPGLGAVSILIIGHGKYAYQTSVYAGFVIFWVSFGMCRYQYAKKSNLSDQFIEAYKSGTID